MVTLSDITKAGTSAFAAGGGGGGSPLVQVSIAAWANPYDTVANKIEFDTVDLDAGSDWSLTNDEFTVPSGGAGKYLAILYLYPPTAGYNLTRDFDFGFGYGTSGASNFMLTTWWGNAGDFGNRMGKELARVFDLADGDKIRALFNLYQSEHTFQARFQIMRIA